MNTNERCREHGVCLPVLVSPGGGIQDAPRYCWPLVSRGFLFFRKMHADTSIAPEVPSSRRPFARAIGILLLVAASPLFAQAPGAGSAPAAESAARKAAEDRAVEIRYRQWKMALAPERQAWESLLEDNLGSFYFPRHQRDKVDGVSNAWDYVADDVRQPRVLLIGDSISRGYTLPVRAALAGRANVHRAPENCGPTANGLKKLDVWLGPGRWGCHSFQFWHP